MINKTVEQFQELNFSGDVIPHTWYESPSLRHESGKPNLVAIVLLANICYWYRPEAVVDENTNRILGIKQKFSHDKLRMYYAQWADKYGFTKRQVKDAIAFLKQRGLITVGFRTVNHNGLLVSNVPHIEPVFEAIKAITLMPARSTEGTRSNVGPMTLARHTPTVETSQLHRSNVRRISKITNTTTDKKEREQARGLPLTGFFSSEQEKPEQPDGRKKNGRKENKPDAPADDLALVAFRDRLKQHRENTVGAPAGAQYFTQEAAGIKTLWNKLKGAQVTEADCIELFNLKLNQWRNRSMTGHLPNWLYVSQDIDPYIKNRSFTPGQPARSGFVSQADINAPRPGRVVL